MPIEPVLNFMVSTAVLTHDEADRYLMIWPLLSKKEQAEILSAFFRLLRSKALSPMLNWETLRTGAGRTTQLSNLEALAIWERSWWLEKEN